MGGGCTISDGPETPQIATTRYHRQVLWISDRGLPFHGSYRCDELGVSRARRTFGSSWVPPGTSFIASGIVFGYGKGSPMIKVWRGRDEHVMWILFAGPGPQGPALNTPARGSIKIPGVGQSLRVCASARMRHACVQLRLRAVARPKGARVLMRRGSHFGCKLLFASPCARARVHD